MVKALMRLLSRFKQDPEERVSGPWQRGLQQENDPLWQCFQIRGGGRHSPRHPLPLQRCFLSDKMPRRLVGHWPAYRGRQKGLSCSHQVLQCFCSSVIDVSEPLYLKIPWVLKKNPPSEHLCFLTGEQRESQLPRDSVLHGWTERHCSSNQNETYLEKSSQLQTEFLQSDI